MFVIWQWMTASRLPKSQQSQQMLPFAYFWHESMCKVPKIVPSGRCTPPYHLWGLASCWQGRFGSPCRGPGSRSPRRQRPWRAPVRSCVVALPPAGPGEGRREESVVGRNGTHIKRKHRWRHDKQQSWTKRSFHSAKRWRWRSWCFLPDFVQKRNPKDGQKNGQTLGVKKYLALRTGHWRKFSTS